VKPADGPSSIMKGIGHGAGIANASTLWHCCADQPVGKCTEIQSITLTTIAACT